MHYLQKSGLLQDPCLSILRPKNCPSSGHFGYDTLSLVASTQTCTCDEVMKQCIMLPQSAQKKSEPSVATPEELEAAAAATTMPEVVIRERGKLCYLQLELLLLTVELLC